MKPIKSSFQQFYIKIVKLPKPIRIFLGILLIFLGFLGFLPVLGFWMIPLGLMVLSIDFPVAKKYLTHVKYCLRNTKRKYTKSLAKKRK